MAKTGVRKNLSVRQKFRKNVGGSPRVKTIGKRSVEGVVKVDPTTLVQPVAQAVGGSESNPTSENGICFSSLRAKMAGTLRAHGDQNSTDVFDKEMLKNLLREVSLKVNSPSGETSQNVLSGVNSKRTTQKYKRSRTADDGKSRKRKAHNLDLDPEQNKAKIKMRKMESDEASGGSSGVDVNKLKRLLRKVTQHHDAEPNSKSEEPLKLKSRNGKGSSTSLRERMVERLNAARFRYINEQLYSVTGFDAQAFFSKERDAFELYHQGYKNQVQKWPINPIDVIIQDILTRPTSLEIADFGCGDAKLATSVPNTVHSFDLIALNDHVVECDISKVPLNNESVDVVVCCLSLMGTNLADYLKEANRVLKLGGELKVAEIESRINNVKTFIRALKTIGFTLIKQDTSHKMFVFLDLIKKKTCPPNKRINIVLQPCLYKKR